MEESPSARATSGDVDAFRRQVEELGERLTALRRAPLPAEDRETLVAELELAHEELRVAEDEVRTQQEEIQDLVGDNLSWRLGHERLLAALPVPVLVTDGQGVVRTANPATAELLGIRPDRLLRKPVLAFVHPSDRPHLRRRLADLAAERTGPFGTVLTLIGRDGETHAVRVAVTRSHDRLPGSGELTWVLLRPSGGDVEAAVHGRVAQALVEMSRIPSRARGDREILAAVAKESAIALDDDASVGLSLGDPTEPGITASSDQKAQAFDGAQMIAGEGPARSAWEEDMTIVAPDVAHDDRWPRLAESARDVPVLAAVATPLRIGDEVAGVLVACAPGHRSCGHRPGEPDPRRARVARPSAEHRAREPCGDRAGQGAGDGSDAVSCRRGVPRPG
jgi:PAS domain S-box-containing protein